MSKRKPAVASTSETLYCSVCSDVADGQHFGADSCRACAAFFRRTISRRLKYICRFDGDCEMGKSYRSLCRACRLEKCLAVGMNASAVRSECVEVNRPPKARLQKAPRSQPHREEGSPPIPATNTNYVWEVAPRGSVDSGVANSIDGDSFPSTSTSSWPRTPPETAEQRSYIHDIVEIKTLDYYMDTVTLPPTHPTLMKMWLAYDGIQKRRDEAFQRTKLCDGVPCRVFTPCESLDMMDYYRMIQAEVTLIAELLNMFDGYKELPHEDKVEIFRHYWIYFVVLERNFDTFLVLGANMDDKRMVFPNGDILDVINCEYDISKVTDKSIEEIRQLIHPWYKLSAQELIQPVKKLGPSDVEMMFCLGYMLWHFSSKLTSKLSAMAIHKSELMLSQLYDELNSYYNHMVSVDNIVRRISELMSFVSLTEQIVMTRKEDIILARTFLNFKVDIFMEEVFQKA